MKRILSLGDGECAIAWDWGCRHGANSAGRSCCCYWWVRMMLFGPGTTSASRARLAEGRARCLRAVWGARWEHTSACRLRESAPDSGAASASEWAPPHPPALIRPMILLRQQPRKSQNPPSSSSTPPSLLLQSCCWELIKESWRLRSFVAADLEALLLQSLIC
jgi:hypothetical protein